MSNDSSSVVKSSLNITMPSDKDMVMSLKSKIKSLPYVPLGNGKTQKRGDTMVTTIDVVDILFTMTANEQFAFKEVYYKVQDSLYFDSHNNPHFEYVQKISFKDNKTNKEKFNRGFKLLEKKEVMKRVGRGRYMISPLLLIDTTAEKEETMEIWEYGKVISKRVIESSTTKLKKIPRDDLSKNELLSFFSKPIPNIFADDEEIEELYNEENN